MNIFLKKATCENDFVNTLQIEKQICRSAESFPPYHIGGLIFDRYLFGKGEPDFFDYGFLIYADKQIIGYTTCFLDENEFDVALIPEYSQYYSNVIPLIDKLFDGNEHSIVVNTNNKDLIAALNSYECNGEKRFQAALSVEEHSFSNVKWENETIRTFCPSDLLNRAQYGYIPTGENLEIELYKTMIQSPYYSYALDYVIFDNESGNFYGFISFWIDKESNTALLEPIACLPDFRRRGIMKRAFNYGLDQLKQRGISQLFVSTSANNDIAQAFYTSVGFKKLGIANLYIKRS